MEDHSTGTSASASTNPKEGGKKASSRRVTSPPVEQVSAATLAALAQASANLWCLPNLLMGATLPSVEQLTAAATKLYAETPPFVHLAKNDSAPQLKIENHSTVKGGMRGYRMARASHGVSEGTYYFEVIVKEPPSVQEIAAALPPNVRLGPKLQKQLQEELTLNVVSEPTENEPNKKKYKTDSTTVGGHLRVGWSMRTADLQAPVGYDKWSFGIRDISGSRIHSSKRHDHWGGEPFGPRDVVGLCMSMGETGGNMRAFKNGDAMGHFVITKGKREGGACFEDIPEGVYYPAVSVYMGGTCQVNFGPHFIYPPRQLPSGMKVHPVSDLSPVPPSTVDRITKALPKKMEESLAKTFQVLVRTETEIRYREYQKHLQDHLQYIRMARQDRGLSIDNLPPAADASTTPVEAKQAVNE
jgi:Set1/Ash2 histone methyltransferase complex subunit ASH2